ncbi:MAG: prolipoprotein diacylglyceryl transferase [Acutalibacteraceae bacterium]|jgi:phosphatidylglycerol:prolipoprotein diacylglycerol transferase
MEVIIFGLKLKLNPVAFTIPLGSKHWDVYWYGIIIAFGFFLAMSYGYKFAPRFNINTDRMLDVVLVTVPVSILCARIYYLLFDGEKLESIGDFFGFNDSSGFAGLAIYGGVIGAFTTGALMCKLRKINILDMFDLGALGFLIGQAIGRWGNFVNQEAFGGFTGSKWWGMQSERTVYYMGAEGLVHPCFLYESVWCIVGFVLLHILSEKRKFSGQIVLMYCAWYGFGRGFIELLRTDSLMLGPVKVSAALSFALCIFAVILLSYIFHKQRKTAAETTYVSVFSENLADDESDEMSDQPREDTEDSVVLEETGEGEAVENVPNSKPQDNAQEDTIENNTANYETQDNNTDSESQENAVGNDNEKPADNDLKSYDEPVNSKSESEDKNG